MADASRVVDIVLQVVGQGQGVIKRYVEEFSGMESAGRKAASGAQSASKSLGELEANLAKVKGFVGLKQAAQETSAALGKTQQEVAGLARQIKDQGNFGQVLQQGLDAARSAAEQLDAALNRQQANLAQAKSRVGELSNEYKQAGQELKQLKADRNADAESLSNAKARYAALKEALAQAREEQRNAAAAVRDAKTAYADAQKSVADYGRQIAANSSALAGTQRDFELARTEAARLKGVFNDQQQTLHRMRQSLAEAGISTKNLAATQRELQAAYEKTRQVTADRDFLGLKPHREIQAEIAKTQQAYQRLASSGQLTGRELAQAMSAARQRIRELHAQTETLDRQIKGIGASWKSMMGLLAGMGAAAAGMKQFGDFESQMLRVSALVESQIKAGDKTMRDLNDKALELGATTRYTAGQVAAAMAEAAMAGQKSTEIYDNIPGVLHMAAAGGMEVADAMDKATNIMAQFGMSGKNDAQKVADVMTAGFTGAATSMTQLSEALVYCGPVAKALNYSLEDTTAVLMTLANAGYKSSMGGTVLRGAIAHLLNPTKEAREILDKYGLSVRNADGTMRNFAEIVRDFGESGMDMASEGIKVFGLRAGPGMAALVGQGADAIEAFQERLNGAGGKAKEVADKMESGFMGSMRRLLAGLSAIAIAFGDTIAPAISAVADKVAELAGWISKLPGPLKGLASGIAVAGMGFAIWKAGLGSMVAIVRGLPQVIKGMLQARASTVQLNAELARVGPTAAASMTQASAAATGLSAKLKGATAAASGATASVGGLSGALAGLFNVGMAFAGGWMFGDMLNNFDIVRKSGASLIYSFDRVMLAAKKMWKFISGGDVGAVDREIEAAKAAYKGLLDDIEKGQDDWSKKQRGEQTTGDVFKEAKRNKGRKPDDDVEEDGGDEKRDAAALAALQAELEAERGGNGPADNWNEEADRRRDRLAEIDEELAERRRAREEQAFDEELARRERLADYERGDKSDENYWADRLEREKELPGNREALERQKELHEQRMAQLAEERKAASERGDEDALEEVGRKEREEEEAHEDETARIEHEQRLKYIELEEQAAQSAHENALARIEAEAEARKQAHEQQLADIQAEREEVEEAHEEKMKLLAEELEAARESGDKKAIREAEKNIEREEKGYEKETARLDKEEKKAIQTEARAKQDDERKKDDEDAAYARERDKLTLKAEKENREEDARKKEKEKERKARDTEEEAEKKAAEAEEAERKAAEEAKAEEEARMAAEAEAAEEADKEREAREERRRRKEEKRERRRARQAAREQKTARVPEPEPAEQERRGEHGRNLAEAREAFAGMEEAARDAAAAQTRAAEDAAKAAAENAEKWQESQRQAAEKAASAVEGYYERLKSASDDVAGRQKSLAEELLELDDTKSAKEKWELLAAQAADYEKQAKAAMEAGDLERAKELADLARSSYGRLKGGAEGIDEKQASREVYAGVKSAGELGIAIAKLQEQQAARDARKQANIAANLARSLPLDARQAQAVADGGQTRAGQGQTGQAQRIDRVHELRFNGGSLRGGEHDIEAFLRGLEQAGMTA